MKDSLNRLFGKWSGKQEREHTKVEAPDSPAIPASYGDTRGRFNKHSSTWLFMKSHLHEEIQRLRAVNDKDLDPVQTASIRGQIKFAKQLLNIEEGW